MIHDERGVKVWMDGCMFSSVHFLKILQVVVTPQMCSKWSFMNFQGTFPEPLVPAANSYVCTQNTQLLGEIFNQTYTPERGISFPPRRCRSASSRCDQCLTQTRCNTPGTVSPWYITVTFLQLPQ